MSGEGHPAEEESEVSFQFVDPLPEELRCPFHRGILQDPVVASCGHSFCQTCLQGGDEQSCPICMSTLSPPFFPNYGLLAVISHTTVQCNLPHCREQFSLDELALHKKSCAGADPQQSPLSPRRPYREPSMTRIKALPSSALWRINFQELKLLYRVGIGAFGEVFKANFRGTVVAVKRVIAQNLQDSEREEIFNRELEFMESLRHPNIVLFVGACLQKRNLCIVTEFMEGGCLKDLLTEAKNGRGLDWSQMLRYCQDAVSGLAYLHGQGIVHRDIKSNNLLVSEKCLKVADFGLARVPEVGVRMSQVGNWAWMAPEMLLGKDYTEKVDVYSFGIVLAEIATLSSAEDLPRTQEMVLDICGVKDLFLPTTPKSFQKAIFMCCKLDPTTRPSFEDLSSLFEKIRLSCLRAPNSDPLRRRRTASQNGADK